MPDAETPRFSVGQFVALINQTLEFAYGSVLIAGELANFRVSKNKWVYFDLKDAEASVRCFGTVYALPGPLEDGLVVEVRGTPRLHPQFGFSVTFASIRPVGEGAIKKASQLLEAKLAAEGLFAAERKRPLPYPPQRIGLITSAESAAYADFTKILAARWQGLQVDLADVQVQGERASGQIVRALSWFNQQATPPEVLIVIRGGGSADDLQAFSTEPVVRAVAASRIPTLVAIGHEVDTSLAELAADVRASTPSNAAELLVPDRRAKLLELQSLTMQLHRQAEQRVVDARLAQQAVLERLEEIIVRLLENRRQALHQQASMLRLLDPAAALKRGFALVRNEQGRLVRTINDVAAGTIVTVQLTHGGFMANVTDANEDYGKEID